MKLELVEEDKPSNVENIIVLLSYILSGVMSLLAMVITAKWIIPLAAKERGYSGAIGGEIFVIAFVGITVWCLLNWIVKEDWYNEVSNRR